MRDLRLRPVDVGSAASPQDIEEWRLELEAFLLDQADEETKKALEKKKTGKWQRLATYDLTCAMDWQFMVLSGYGWSM